MYHPDDTIAAIASAAGGAARGIVRVSGPRVLDIVSQCFTPGDSIELAQVHRPTAITGHCQINLPQTSPLDARQMSVDCDLFLWPNDRSYTRQPLAELHTVGSPPILGAMVDALTAAGARLAEPGEFTLRAFLAGRIDLTQAEAILGVIDARGQQELDTALAQLAGGLARPLTALRNDILQLLAELEAGLDFVDEDIEFISAAEVADRLARAQRQLTDVATQVAGRLSSGRLPQVVLTGPPNAGKSSLFNALVARSSRAQLSGGTPPALVSAESGTTRDYLTATLWLDDLACELVDTAGVEPSDVIQAIDASAQSAATERRAQASHRIWCIDAAAPVTFNPLRSDDNSFDSLRDVVALTKVDLEPPLHCTRTDLFSGAHVIATSSRTGEGLSELRHAIRALLEEHSPTAQAAVVATTAERCRESLRRAADAFARAEQLAADRAGDELLAVEIRLALDELGKVSGAIYTDDLLDRIFSTFCIGK
jgi:tRNA modification GTPase